METYKSPTRVDRLTMPMRGAIFSPEEADEIINVVKSRTREERPDGYLLAMAKELMPDAVYIAWAREAGFKLDKS